VILDDFSTAPLLFHVWRYALSTKPYDVNVCVYAWRMWPQIKGPEHKSAMRSAPFQEINVAEKSQTDRPSAVVWRCIGRRRLRSFAATTYVWKVELRCKSVSRSVVWI